MERWKRLERLERLNAKMENEMEDFGYTENFGGGTKLWLHGDLLGGGTEMQGVIAKLFSGSVVELPSCRVWQRINHFQLSISYGFRG